MRLASFFSFDQRDTFVKMAEDSRFFGCFRIKIFPEFFNQKELLFVLTLLNHNLKISKINFYAAFLSELLAFI